MVRSLLEDVIRGNLGTWGKGDEVLSCAILPLSVGLTDGKRSTEIR